MFSKFRRPKRLKIDERITILHENIDVEEEEDEDYDPETADDEEEDEEDGFDESFAEDDVTASAVEQSEDERAADDIISTRTRSKHQIDEHPKDTLDFPDAPPDLYKPDDGFDVDQDWLEFLNSLFDNTPTVYGLFDEENDPEFSFEISDLARQSNQEENIKVSRTEAEKIDCQPEESCDIPEESSVTDWVSLIDKEVVSTVCHQMTQHVQLLATTYLLCKDRESIAVFSEAARTLLNELVGFGGEKKLSVYKTVNLQQAAQIVLDNPRPKKYQPPADHTWRGPKILPSVLNVFLDNPKVFRCVELLPQSGYHEYDPDAIFKLYFTDSEDWLVANGLEQHKFRVPNRPLVNLKTLKFIQEYLLPPKSISQLQTRVKNCRRRFQAGNPLCHYLKSGEILPVEPIPCHLEEDHDTFKDISRLPPCFRNELLARKKISEGKLYIAGAVPLETVEGKLYIDDAVASETDEDDLPVSGSSKRSAPKRKTKVVYKDWTPEEDRELFTVVKKELSEKKALHQKVFQQLGRKLDRTGNDVAFRFNKLMGYLKETQVKNGKEDTAAKSVT
ncbi:hypothetical protein HDE_05168 [Halotydeus destructor]|nr:hypothetical protein HDE_05168 [Halotydeus destructor]